MKGLATCGFHPTLFSFPFPLSPAPPFNLGFVSDCVGTIPCELNCAITCTVVPSGYSLYDVVRI